VPDGAVDFEVNEPVPALGVERRSDWHVTGKQLPGTTELKKWIRLQLEGGSVRDDAVQVVVVTNTGVTGHKRTARDLESSLKVRLIDAEQVAGWVNRFPALAVSVRNVEGLGAAWLDLALLGHATPFLWDETREAFRNRVAQDLSSGRTVFHLEGFAGIGKTRLALETVKTVHDGKWGDQVVYFREPRTSVVQDLLSRMATSPAGTTSLFLIVDECSLNDRRILKELVQERSGIRLLTIGRASETTRDPGVSTVEPLSAEQMQKFLSHRLDDPQLIALLIKECGGYIKAAEFLSAKTKELTLTYNAAAQLVHDGALFAEALGDDSEVLQGVALLDEVEWERSDEIAALCNYFHFWRPTLNQVAERAHQRGLFQSAGSRRYLSPHVLAASLALRCISTHGNKLLELFQTLPHRGRMAMIRRLTSLAKGPDGDAGSRRLLRTILGDLPPPDNEPSERYSDRSEIEALRSELSRAIPEDALATIERPILSMSQSQLKGLHRRTIVEILEEAACEDRLFHRVARVTLRLAATETEPYVNNATGLWEDLFKFGLSRTGANNHERLSTLRTLVDSKDPLERKLAARGLGRLLDLENSTVVARSEDHYRGRPQDLEDTSSVVQAALPLLVRLATSDEVEAVRAGARAELHHALRYGLKYSPRHVLESLDALNESRDRETRRKALAEIEWVLANPERFPLSPETRQSLQTKALAMSPVEFSDRLHGWLESWRMADLKAPDVVELECRKLAAEVVGSPTLLEAEFEWVARRVPAPAHSHTFWFHVGVLDTAAGFLSRFVREARLGHAAYAFAAYARGQVQEGRGDLIESELDSLARGVVPTTNVALEVTWRMKATERGLTRILDLADRNALAAANSQPLVLSVEVPETVAYWATELQYSGFASIVDLAHRYELPRLAYGLTGALQAWSKAHENERTQTRELKERVTDLLPVLVRSDDRGSLYFWRHHAVDTNRPMKVAQLIVQVLQVEREFAQTGELVEVLTQLSYRDPAVWPLFGDLLLARGRVRFAAGQVFAPADAYVEEVLIPWARTRADGAVLLATLTHLPSYLAVRLIEEFQSDDRVARTLSERHLFPSNDTREREEFLRDRRAEAVAWMREPSKALRLWATRQVATIDAMVRASRAA
jgi:hypothetical protein